MNELISNVKGFYFRKLLLDGFGEKIILLLFCGLISICSLAQDKFYLVGEFNKWNPNNTSISFSNNGNGTWTAKATSFYCGTQGFKIMKNGSWDTTYSCDRIINPGESFALKVANGNTNIGDWSGRTYSNVTFIITVSNGIPTKLFVNADNNTSQNLKYTIISADAVEVATQESDGNQYDGDKKLYRSYYGGDIVIPSTVTISGKTYTVKRIGEMAFRMCDKLTSVVIPNTVTSIGYGAFAQSHNLTSVTIPNSVTLIGEKSFFDCQGLTSIIIPASVETIGFAAFCHNYKLTTVDIPNSVKSLGASAFYHCIGLKSVTIGNSVSSIGKETFDLCTALTSAKIGTGVTSIEEKAFSGCEALTTINIPASVKTIGENAFLNTYNLKNITWGNYKNAKIDALAFNQSGYEQKRYANDKAVNANATVQRFTKKYGAAMVNSVVKVFKNKQNPGALPIGAPLDLVIALSKAYERFDAFAYGSPESEFNNARGSWKKYRLSAPSLGVIQLGDGSWTGDWVLWFLNGKLTDKDHFNY